MKVEEAIFRYKEVGTEEWSFKLTRSELLRELTKMCMVRADNWPYTIKPNKYRIVTNIFGKKVIVRRELSFDQQRISELNPGYYD